MAMKNIKKHMQKKTKNTRRQRDFLTKVTSTISTKRQDNHITTLQTKSKCHQWQNVGHAKYTINPSMKTHSALS